MLAFDRGFACREIYIDLADAVDLRDGLCDCGLTVRTVHADDCIFFCHFCRGYVVMFMIFDKREDQQDNKDRRATCVENTHLSAVRSVAVYALDVEPLGR